MAVLSSTTPHYVIDKSHQAQGKSQRIRFIVLHYTAENEAASLEILTKGNVSAQLFGAFG